MRVLAVTHGPNVGPGVFADAVRERGDELDEWCVPDGSTAPGPGRHDAVMVFGGGMHADQEDRHGWLRAEDRFLRAALERGTPLLGVCLGAQLVAKAAGASVHPASEPEVGWLPVDVTEEGAADPVFARLPRRFEAFQWHSYTYDLPRGARPLAESPVCNQAYRLGSAWCVQFHPEVTVEIVESWLDEEDPPEGSPSRDEIAAQTRTRIAGWNALGRKLCGAFLDAVA